jgi:DMSO/TMAO reductase YedYZ heme-binding membrane subunit
MATGILASLFMASMGAQGAVLWMTEAGWIGSGTARTVGDATGVTSETAAFVGFAVLATVLLGSWLLARLRRRATGP